MAYNWQRLHRLVYRFGKLVPYNRLQEITYDEDTGEERRIYEETSVFASIQPIKKKGSIGGENELQLVYDEDGDWESGGFLIYATNNENIRVGDYLPNLTINGENYGDAYVDKIQNWSNDGGLYKARIILTSIMPTMENFGVDNDDY